MNADQRLEIISSRFRPVTPQTAKPTGLHAATNPEAKQKRRKKPRGWRDGRRGFMVYARYTGNERRLGQGAEWVTEPIKVPKKCLSPKRTKRVSALTRISQLLPIKLPKIGRNS